MLYRATAAPLSRARNVAIARPALLWAATFITVGCGRQSLVEPRGPLPVANAVEQKAAAPFVPFKWSGTTFSSPPTASARCPELIVNVRAEATATHLGAFVAAASHCVSNTSLEFRDGIFTFTGANGDAVHGTHAGRFTPTATLPVHTFEGTFEIAGGTGRFIDARGGGTLAGTIDFATGIAQIAFDGQITPPRQGQGF